MLWLVEFLNVMAWKRHAESSLMCPDSAFVGAVAAGVAAVLADATPTPIAPTSAVVIMAVRILRLICPFLS
jgi:hypothetical protein